MEEEDAYFVFALKQCQSVDFGQRMAGWDLLEKEFAEQVDARFLLTRLAQTTIMAEQRAILAVMSQMGERAPVADLQAILIDHASSLRAEVASVLATEGITTPMETFITILRDQREEPHLRVQIAELLGLCGERVPVDVLVEALSDADADVCAAALSSLGARGAAMPVEAMLACVEHPAWPVRKAAIQALSCARERAPIDPIVAALSDAEPRVRATAAEGMDRVLEWHGGRVPLAPLFTVCEDSDAFVRECALYTLSKHPQDAPVELVVQALDDLNPYVRCAALTVLEQMGRAHVPASVDQKLQEMAALEPHVNARKYAIKTLFVLKGVQPGSAHEYPGEATQD